MDKVFQTDEFSAMAIAGAAGPCVEMAKLFRIELEHYEKLDGKPLTCEGKATRLGYMVKANFPMVMQGLVVIPLFVGYDQKHEIGRLFKYDITGGRYEDTEFHAVGSGGKDARLTLKEHFRILSANRMDKVFQTDEFSAMAIAGAAGPCVEMAKLFRIELEHYEKLDGKPLTCEGKATRLGYMVSGFPSTSSVASWHNDSRVYLPKRGLNRWRPSRN